MTKRLRHALLLGGACCGIRSGSDAFAPPAASAAARASSTRLHRHSNGFVGFQGDGAPIRDYNGSNGMSNQVASSRPSNLSRRGGGSPYDRPSVNDDSYSYPHANEMERRYSQPPPMDVRAMPHVHQRTRGYDGRLQGGSRYTYQHDSPYGGGYPRGMSDGRTFVETDGRPLDVEVEVWDGPNNAPSKVKMYSEDGARRPMNILSGGGGGTTSVRNVGSMEFPARASVGGGMGAVGGYGGMSEYGYGAPMGAMSHGGGYGAPMPSTARGETVQGGALKTFSLPSHVNAVQVTVTSDGLPVNAKVELWGTSTHVKQLAEVYNDNGQTRPFAAVIDVPGGENTIAVRNTGPMEYPIKVVVEPVADPYGMGMDGRMGGGGMMDGGYGRRRGPPMGMMDGGYGPPMPMGGFLPPPPPF